MYSDHLKDDTTIVAQFAETQKHLRAAISRLNEAEADANTIAAFVVCLHTLEAAGKKLGEHDRAAELLQMLKSRMELRP